MAPRSADPETANHETTPFMPIEQSTGTNGEHSSSQQDRASLWEDARDTITLGFPIFLAMTSWVAMKTTDSAILGHVSADALAAASLSDLWTMCTAVFIQARVLSVLCGAAVGAGNPKLAGIYLQVSYLVLSVVIIVVVIAWSMTETVWKWMGSDETIARMAGYYAKVLAWSLPGQLAFSQLQQFFSAQRILRPEVNASAMAMICNLVLGLFFVLGWPVTHWNGFGFMACPIVTTVVVYLQLGIFWTVYIHYQQLHAACWPGWKWHELTWSRITTFTDLYLPAALGSASDFWRVAVVGAVAEKLGEVEVAVFNTSYRIMWIVLILVNALSSAAGIQMNLRLGKNDPKGARQAGEIGIILSALILAMIGGSVYAHSRWFGRIFTNDETFLELFESARLPFTITLILMNLSVAIERIPYAMGRTKQVFWLGFVSSWGAQVPAVMLLTKYWRDDLFALYSGMAIGYATLVLLYGYVTLTRYVDRAVLVVTYSQHSIITNRNDLTLVTGPIMPEWPANDRRCPIRPANRFGTL